jgi:uncharacterized protein YbjT (DUF2867 family)
VSKAESKVLVIGATGTVGAEAARAALAAGAQVRALVRSQASAARLDPGVDALRGDLRDAGAVARALQGVQAALYVSPHEPDEEQLAEQFIRACETARVRLVFVGVHIDAPTRLGRALRRLVYGRLLPHYRPKFEIAERARQSGADPVVLVPTNFFQNDELFREEIAAGSFPQPFERPVNRVDVRDLGAAAARAMLDRALPSGAYPVVGPNSLTGAQCAAAWSAALGRPVRCPSEQTAVDAAIARSLTGKKREDFLATYAVLRRFALPTDPALLARTQALLGRAPRAYDDYVRELAARWRAQSQTGSERARPAPAQGARAR